MGEGPWYQPSLVGYIQGYYYSDQDVVEEVGAQLGFDATPHKRLIADMAKEAKHATSQPAGETSMIEHDSLALAALQADRPHLQYIQHLPRFP